MNSLYYLVFLLFIYFQVATAKKFGKCELYGIMKDNGFPESELPDWICLVEAESKFNTSTVGGPNKNRSYDWGLFQINDRFWCSDSETPGKDCKVKCKDLITEDISASLKCIKKIHKRHGFKAWYGWQRKCKGKTLASLSECKIS